MKAFIKINDSYYSVKPEEIIVMDDDNKVRFIINKEGSITNPTKSNESFTEKECKEFFDILAKRYPSVSKYLKERII